MTPALIANLEQLLGGPRDNALLRFSLGSEYLKAGDVDRAVTHLREALTRDPGYSAAWKLLGRALAESGDRSAALRAYEEGIRVAAVGVRRNHPRALDPAIKSSNLLNNILAVREAQARGCDEPLLLNHEGYLAEGASTKEVGAQLFISPVTVRNHIQHTLKKLDLHTRLEAILWVIHRRM